MAGLYSTILQELTYCLTKAFLLPQLSIPFPKGIHAIPKMVKKKIKVLGYLSFEHLYRHLFFLKDSLFYLPFVF